MPCRHRALGGRRPGGRRHGPRRRLRLGILAIAAGLFGARSVLGVDTDPIAVESTGANAARNDLGGVITVRRGPCRCRHRTARSTWSWPT